MATWGGLSLQDRFIAALSQLRRAAYRLIYPSIVIAPTRPRGKKKSEGEPPHLVGLRQIRRHVAS